LFAQGILIIIKYSPEEYLQDGQKYCIFINIIISREKIMHRPINLNMNRERRLSVYSSLTTRPIFKHPSIKPHHNNGSVAVEFALVLPLLLFLVFSIIECSFALYDKAVITNASREAARAGIVLRTPKLTKTEIATIASNYCQNNLISFAQNASPTVLVTDNGTNTFGTPLQVSVSYVYTGLGFGQLISALAGPMTMNASTTMNNE
jgi:hypothetical protein